MLTYKVSKSTIASKDGKKKFYPRLVKRGTATIDEIAEKLALQSTLSKGDTYNVIKNLPGIMKEILMDGRSVNMEGLGTFTVSSSIKYGVDTSEEVTPNQIKNLRVLFTPTGTRTPMDGTTRSMFTGVHFERIDKVESAKGTGSTGGEEEPIIDPNA